ncbi:thiamine pyrophosphate-dependent enzyme [Nocardiopsis tropica]|uniref:2-oxoisovalerate dehydrogenase subunit alpha n=1 Tax=Nocardiopsis tropica TaxID=109330 RepID=A0ABV1ZQT3_9ACTN
MKHTDERPRPAPPPPPVEPVRLVDRHGLRVEHPGFTAPDGARLAGLHRAMVIGRRFDRQARALAGQGLLAVYPSSAGQEASQVGGVLALSDRDWLFPGYRDSVALVAHGVDPVEALTLFRGDWRPGYDPRRYRCAPQCTPVATNASHAVGLTYAARREGRDVAALALTGDGGDTDEAYDFAAVWNTPVVFLVRGGHRAAGAPPYPRGPAPVHGAPGHDRKGYRVDGADAAAVYAVVSRALAEARDGGGPAVVEAVAYREDPRSCCAPPRREGPEPGHRCEGDPVTRVEALLRAEGLLGDPGETERALAALGSEAEEFAASVRERMAPSGGRDPRPPSEGVRPADPSLPGRRREPADGARMP